MRIPLRDAGVAIRDFRPRHDSIGTLSRRIKLQCYVRKITSFILLSILMVNTQYAHLRHEAFGNHIDFITTGEKRCPKKRELTTCISVRAIFLSFLCLSSEAPGIRSV